MPESCRTVPGTFPQSRACPLFPVRQYTFKRPKKSTVARDIPQAVLFGYF
jgi:hypothetical protein